MNLISVIVAIFILAICMALPTMLFWNWLMPDIFGLTSINFLQAIGINMLSGILSSGLKT